MNRLKEVRFFKRINQYQLANMSGVHQSRISLIENNFEVSTQTERECLAKALDSSVEELFGSKVMADRLVASLRKDSLKSR